MNAFFLLSGDYMRFSVFDSHYFSFKKLFKNFLLQKIPALEAKNGALYEADKIEQAKAILRPYILRRLKLDVSFLDICCSLKWLNEKPLFEFEFLGFFT